MPKSQHFSFLMCLPISHQKQWLSVCTLDSDTLSATAFPCQGCTTPTHTPHRGDSHTQRGSEDKGSSQITTWTSMTPADQNLISLQTSSFWPGARGPDTHHAMTCGLPQSLLHLHLRRILERSCKLYLIDSFSLPEHVLFLFQGTGSLVCTYHYTLSVQCSHLYLTAGKSYRQTLVKVKQYNN